jgi:hypothetical protein
MLKQWRIFGLVAGNIPTEMLHKVAYIPNSCEIRPHPGFAYGEEKLNRSHFICHHGNQKHNTVLQFTVEGTILWLGFKA